MNKVAEARMTSEVLPALSYPTGRSSAQFEQIHTHVFPLQE